MAETERGIYYPTKEDHVDLENDFPKMAGSIDGLLGEIGPDQLTTALQELLVPTASIFATATSTAPTGYLLCDGSAVSRTTYKALFEAIGTAYGAGNGSTTFSVPDLRGRVPVGVDGAAGRLSANDELGKAAGEEKHTLSEAEMPSHAHLWAVLDTEFSIKEEGLGARAEDRPRAVGAGNVTTSTSAAGGSGAHNNMQPYQIVNYLIKT